MKSFTSSRSTRRSSTRPARCSSSSGAAPPARSSTRRPPSSQLLADDFSVIESEPEAPELPRCEPARLRRVVASLDAASDPTGFVENRDVVSAWIAVRFGVDAEQLSDADAQPGFLERLARAAGLRRLLP